ncbi:carbamoyltransferase N-terminal domain-containing protein [Micromonospora sp. CPCC 206061]|uniref:carbamoyltransferase N-terminal domain-containing protein n=1 Tax=Micromonospora sp. CPCC 206061 TaxID=3122410 RepID=UPI002FF1A1B0
MKLTHDGTVAVVDGTELLFSIELEKIANNRRYSSLSDLDQIAEILASQGLTPDEIDVFAVDGWQWRDGPLAALPVTAGGRSDTLAAAPYHEIEGVSEVHQRYEFAGLTIDGRAYPYVSYHHATDHLYSAYCTSPFAARGEDALVLVWDGGMLPLLYLVRGGTLDVKPLGALFPLPGSMFAFFAAQFDPFWRDTTGLPLDEQLRVHLEVAGKAMAYAALGRVEPEAFDLYPKVWKAIDGIPLSEPSRMTETVRRECDMSFPGLSSADLIATCQAYLGEVLVSGLRERLAEMPDPPRNLCLAGGCALNIKWNSLLRGSGLVREVWVPPFPNDSGVALGAACAEMAKTQRAASLAWNVYQGPRLAEVSTPPGWIASPCDERGLAQILHQGHPVVFLDGRAELGPRALGNRSILAAPVQASMKDRLNEMKARAGYRPVAPVCLESRAPEIFDPGTPDPYMLFDHRVRPEWTERVAAVVHVDGTARLQTINSRQHPRLARVLESYERLSGIPLLCNTSANLLGRGFFPDVRSALEWGGTDMVWSDGVLYQRGRRLA